MIRKLKEYKLRRHLKKGLLDTRQGDLIKLMDAKSVGIIFFGDDIELTREIYEFQKELNHQGSKVSVLNYLEERKSNIIYKFPLVSNEDLDYFLRPQNSSTEAFLTKNYDILIDFSSESNLSFDFIVAETKAKCKVGFYNIGRENYYDVMIQLNSNYSPQNMTKNLWHYLNL